MNRRDILKNIGLGTVGVAVSGGAALGQAKGAKRPAGQPAKGKAMPAQPDKQLPDVEGGFLRHELDRNKRLMAEKFFNDHEMKTISVLADIIIPADGKSGSATQAGVPAFIEFIVKDMPQHQTPMRGGLMWLDNECQRRHGKTFVELPQNQQLAMVDLIAYPSKAKKEHSQGVSFFNLMRNLTATGFFTSEMGLKDLGYMGNTPNQWDGVPADVLAQYNLSYADWEKHANKS